MPDGIKKKENKRAPLLKRAPSSVQLQQKKRLNMGSKQKYRWKKSKQADQLGLFACAGLSFRPVQNGRAVQTDVCDQPWLANAREWLGVPYFIGMGTDWALLKQVKCQFRSTSNIVIQDGRASVSGGGLIKIYIFGWKVKIKSLLN